MTRAEFDQLRSFSGVACPDCGSNSTHPEPGCRCPGGKHILKYHHTCSVPAEHTPRDRALENRIAELEKDLTDQCAIFNKACIKHKAQIEELKRVGGVMASFIRLWEDCLVGNQMTKQDFDAESGLSQFRFAKTKGGK